MLRASTIAVAAALWLRAAGADDALAEIPVTTAAEPTPQAASQPIVPQVLDDIVVTAQKRPESQQDVPISVTALGAEQLQARGIDDPIRLQLAVPGMVYDEVADVSFIFLRGVGTNGFVASADLSVATYIDGVYFPFSWNLARSFGAVERVEVLKGPQGTLFGRNATGGAINVITRAPPDHTSGFVQVGGASFDRRDVNAWVGAPLGENLSFSLAGYRAAQDDDYHLAPGSALPGLDPARERGVNPKIRWQPGGALDFTFAATFIDRTGGGTAGLVAEAPVKPLGAAAGVQPCNGDYEYCGNVPPESRLELNVESLTANWRPGPFDVRSISAHQGIRNWEWVDFDCSAAAVSTIGQPIERGPISFGHFVTHELQLLSHDGGWLSSAHLTWLAGYYYLRGVVAYDPVAVTLFGLDANPQDGTPLPLPLPLPVGAELVSHGRLDTTSHSAYAQASWRPIDLVELTLGGRYTRERRRVYGLATDVGLADGSALRLMSFADANTGGNDFSPKLALSLRPLEDLLIYGSWQQAYKSASFNVLPVLNPPAPIRAETVRTLEAGVKSELWQHRLRVNAAVFSNRIHDMQTQYISQTNTGGMVAFINAELGRSRGIELAVDVAPLTGFTLNLAATWLDARYLRFPNASGFDPQLGITRSNLDFSGNRIVLSPRFSATGAATYLLALGNGAIELGADAYRSSAYWFDAQNTTAQAPYTMLGARLGYRYWPWGLRLTLFGDNLTDARRYLFRSSTDFGVGSRLAPPATYGARLAWEF